ncbi:hypothetical protein AAES_157985 [Amazona aestiva]|uniref:Uncharacterized protein n=1 Tax=Amazona aestiva TaxID=12930 RepID=A0A0Q3LUV7_AMAAE|nr:hypothetical protein AAES_157985 [Amazona aestiva]
MFKEQTWEQKLHVSDQDQRSSIQFAQLTRVIALKIQYIHFGLFPTHQIQAEAESSSQNKYKRIQNTLLQEICIGISLVSLDATMANETKQDKMLENNDKNCGVSEYSIFLIVNLPEEPVTEKQFKGRRRK